MGAGAVGEVHIRKQVDTVLYAIHVMYHQQWYLTTEERMDCNEVSDGITLCLTLFQRRVLIKVCKR